MEKHEGWIYEAKITLVDGSTFLFYDTMPRCIEKINSFEGALSQAKLKLTSRR